MSILSVIEGHLAELPIELFLHLLQQVNSVFGFCCGILLSWVEINVRQFEGATEVDDDEVIVAAEHIEEDGVLSELQGLLEGVEPSEENPLNCHSSIGIPVEAF